MTQYLTACRGLDPEADLNALQANLVKLCINMAVAECDTKPIWGVQFAGDDGAVQGPPLTPGRPCSFSILIDVHPAIEWPDWSDIEITRPTREVSEDMIEAELLEQRLGMGPTESVAGEFTAGDVIQVEAVVEDSETGATVVTFASGVVIPSPSRPFIIANIILEGLHGSLRDRSVGDEIELTGRILRGFPNPELAGKTVRARLLIKAGIRRTPVSIEEVLTKYGTPNELILREQIRHALEATAQRDQTEILNHEVLTKVQALVADQLQLPDRVLRTFESGMRDAMRRKLESGGLADSQIEAELASREDEIGGGALHQAQHNAVISLLAQRLELKASEQDFMRWTAETAARQGRRPEEIRKEFSDPEQLKQVAMQIIRQKIVKLILDDATVTDVDADIWDGRVIEGS